MSNASWSKNALQCACELSMTIWRSNQQRGKQQCQQDVSHHTHLQSAGSIDGQVGHAHDAQRRQQRHSHNACNLFYSIPGALVVKMPLDEAIPAQCLAQRARACFWPLRVTTSCSNFTWRDSPDNAMKFEHARPARHLH